MATHRHIARMAAMQTIFTLESRKNEPEPTLGYITEELHPKLSDSSFALELVNGVLKEQKKLHEVISENAPEWPIEKIAPIDRAILEIGTYELLFIDDIPPIVSINEAIEIAKRFGEINSGKFINGVLSSIMNKYCPEKGKKDDKKDKSTESNKSDKSK